MFKSITLENFFSFGKSTKIELNPGVNILVGINGSGKSNFIRAIELLSDGLQDIGLKKLINGKWGGIDGIQFSASVRNANTLVEFEIISGHTVPHTFRLILLHQGNAGLQFEKTIELNHGGVQVFDLNNSEILWEDDNGKIWVNSGEYASHAIGLDRPIALYSGFDTSLGSYLRRLAGFDDEVRLSASGENLTSLLSQLNSKDIASFERILEELKGVNPNFRDISFSTPVAGKTLLALKEKGLNRTVPIEFISDGTLRFLLLLAILYNPNRGAVVCLDEPEMGLHPDMINSVAKGIQYAAQNGTQMIVSTHSPLLLNAFELEDILIFEKDADNQTVVKRKYEEDFKDWEGEFLAGQMWVRGQLGGVRW